MAEIRKGSNAKVIYDNKELLYLHSKEMFIPNDATLAVFAFAGASQNKF